MERRTISTHTRNNWLLDAGLFVSALAVIVSGIYFLYAPTGGYRGGRNAAYHLVVLFGRSTWGDIHTWTGIAMVVAVMGHLAIHWKWIVSMTRRIWHELTGQCDCMNARGRFNVFVDLVIAISFLLVSVSGIYLLFFGGSHGGSIPDPLILFRRATWDLLHIWSGVSMTVAAMLHFAIHWRWVVKVTGRVFTGSQSGPNWDQVRPAA